MLGRNSLQAKARGLPSGFSWSHHVWLHLVCGLLAIAEEKIKLSVVCHPPKVFLLLT